LAIWRLSAAAAAVVLGIGVAEAGERERLGWSLAISNDSIGEFLDRWQSASVQYGAFYGSSWEGAAPTRFGELLEFRFRTDFLRAGLDVTFGRLGRGDQMVRAVTTGHRVPVGLGGR
jgi:hypothetical protein